MDISLRSLVDLLLLLLLFREEQMGVSFAKSNFWIG